MPSPREFRTSLHPSIPLDDDGGYWQGTITVGQDALAMSVYIDASIRDDLLSSAAALIEKVADLRRLGLEAIRKRGSGGIVGGFFEFHQEELPDVAPPSSSIDELVAALRLVGLGVHPDDDSFMVVLDFSFGREHSDELLAVKFSPQTDVLVVSHES